MEQVLLERQLPVVWSQDSRGFWTKRKKTAGSLLAILALIAGIAVAYKMFDRTVPNNVVRDAAAFNFEVHVLRTQQQAGLCPDGSRVPDQNASTEWCRAGTFGTGTEPIFRAGTDMYPGDTRHEYVRVVNLQQSPAKDFTAFMHVDQSSIAVRRCPSMANIDPTTGVCNVATVAVLQSDPNWSKFVNYFSLEILKEKVLGENVIDVAEFNENGGLSSSHPEDAGFPTQTTTACQGGLRELTAASPCNMGTIRAFDDEEIIRGQDLDVRWYDFDLTEADDGTDQSFFRGWELSFGFVFQARVPALPDDSAPIAER